MVRYLPSNVVAGVAIALALLVGGTLVTRHLRPPPSGSLPASMEPSAERRPSCYQFSGHWVQAYQGPGGSEDPLRRQFTLRARVEPFRVYLEQRPERGSREQSLRIWLEQNGLKTDSLVPEWFAKASLETLWLSLPLMRQLSTEAGLAEAWRRTETQMRVDEERTKFPWDDKPLLGEGERRQWSETVSVPAMQVSVTRTWDITRQEVQCAALGTPFASRALKAFDIQTLRDGLAQDATLKQVTALKARQPELMATLITSQTVSSQRNDALADLTFLARHDPDAFSKVERALGESIESGELDSIHLWLGVVAGTQTEQSALRLAHWTEELDRRKSPALDRAIRAHHLLHHPQADNRRVLMQVVSQDKDQETRGRALLALGSLASRLPAKEANLILAYLERAEKELPASLSEHLKDARRNSAAGP